MARRGYHLRKHKRTSSRGSAFVAGRGYTYRNPNAKELITKIPSRPLGPVRLREVGPVNVISEKGNVITAQRIGPGGLQYNLTLKLKGKEFKPPKRGGSVDRVQSHSAEHLKGDLFGERFRRVWSGSKRVVYLTYPKRPTKAVDHDT